MKIRRLKIRSRLDNRSMDPVPVIKLQGRWLELLGFYIGQTIEVQEEDEKVTIRVAPLRPDSLLVKNTNKG